MVKTRVLVKALLVLTLSTLISACSGGGGGSGQGNGVINLSPTVTATVTVQIGTASLPLNAPSTPVTATVLDASGNPIAGLQVTFSTTLGSLSPASGIAITDASGLATVQLSAGDTAGAGLVSATASVAGVKVSNVAPFTVALPPISISTPVLGLASLAPGGSTSVTVSLTDASGAPFTTPVDVSFTSNFVTAGKATLISPVRSVNGVASSTYTASGGVGNDTITVFIGGNTSQPITVTVAGAGANSISFVSATPTNISLKGTGGVGGSVTSTVVFKVLDTNSQPKAGQTVDFSLNTSVGGLVLTSPSAASDQSGLVQTTVTAGTVATPVRVTASIHGSSPAIQTMSDLLSVSTGIPAQDGMSLAVVTHNVEAFDTDGVNDVFTVFLADHFGNPVPDGTAVNFSAQVGQIQPSCLTANGRCSATWTSSGARTADGKAAILAYAIGEESFGDSDGSGLADGIDVNACLTAGGLQSPVVCGEFTDTTQAWRDDAHARKYLPGDLFIDFNNSGKVDRDGIFNGVLRPAAVVGQRTKHVFANNVIVMSTSSAVINNLSRLTLLPASGNPTTPIATTVSGSVQDGNGNPVSAGSTVAIASQSACLTISPASFIIPNTVLGPNAFNTSITNSCAAGTGSPGSITVDVTSPAGLITSRNFSFTW